MPRVLDHSADRSTLSDQEGIATIEQIKAARALLESSQEDLAARAGLSIATITRFEARSKLRVSDEARLMMEAALEAAGIEFTNGHKPGVSLDKRGKE